MQAEQAKQAGVAWHGAERSILVAITSKSCQRYFGNIAFLLLP